MTESPEQSPRRALLRLVDLLSRPNRTVLLTLLGLALLTRLLWVLWIHPPSAYVFSDMHGYVTRALRLVEHGFQPGTRDLAWQSYGTHYLLAGILAIVGKANLYAAGVVWGLMGASVIPMAYALAARVCTRPWMAAVVGFAALLWHPNLVTTGFFTSETPALCFGVWATWRLAVLLQDGRGALQAGVAAAFAFALRPQLAVFFTLTVVLWAFTRWRGGTTAKLGQVLVVGACLAGIFGFSLWRFHEHTGTWGGIAEAANANRTAARCHNARTQAFRTKAQLDRSRSVDDGRLIGIIPFQTRMRKVSHEHFLGMRPALGTRARAFTIEVERKDGTREWIPVRIAKDGFGIKFVGYIGDPDIHRALQRLCIERTGPLEQLRYAFVNLTGLWIYNSQWPDSSRNREYFHRYSKAFIVIFNAVVLLPSMLGIALALRRRRENPALVLCALQLLGLYFVSSFFFGSIRLRTPYDVFALVLAVEGYAWIAGVIARRRAARRVVGSQVPQDRSSEP
ncbi:MAG: hypothetical protein H6713_02870 [Myxococcales bacterium]|nr:hypothetical protein [Myxococcales bacterium]